MKILTLLSAVVITVVITAFGIGNSNGINNITEEVLTEQSTASNKHVVMLKSGFGVPVSDDYPGGQSLYYSVRGKYDKPVTQEELKKAEMISDLIENYPHKWIKEYVSVEVKASDGNHNVIAMGKDDKLTEEQLEVFQNAELATDIVVDVDYKSKNYINNEIESQELKVYMTVVPEKEATYAGGYEKMIYYLEENSRSQMETYDLNKMQRAIIQFTVNEKGETESIRIGQSTGEEEVDKLLVDLISAMPDWNPAEQADGKKVKQHFEFTVGRDGC